MELYLVASVLLELLQLIAMVLILVELRNQPPPAPILSVPPSRHPTTEYPVDARKATTPPVTEETVQAATEFVMKEVRNRGSTITPELARQHALELLGQL